MSVLVAILDAVGCVLALAALSWSSWRIAGALCGGGATALRVAVATYTGVLQVAVVVEVLGLFGLLDWPLVLVLQLTTAAAVRWRVPRPAPAAAHGGPARSWQPFCRFTVMSLGLPGRKLPRQTGVLRKRLSNTRRF